MSPSPNTMVLAQISVSKSLESGQAIEINGSDGEHPVHDDSTEILKMIDETRISMDLFLTNKFQEAEERMALLAHRTMYHALGHGSLLFIKAMMTCDRADMERAMEAARSGSVVIDRFRARYSIADSIYRMGGMQKPLTNEQIHAELCYAEMLMSRAILTFFYDESLTSFIKGAFKIRSCYQSFKECYRILNTNTSWLDSPDEASNTDIKRQFECGVRMGIGTFNLMLSALPTKLLRLLEVVGFSGNKTFGMMELHMSSSMSDTMRSPLVCMMLLSWYLVVTYLVGAGCQKSDLSMCRQLLNPLIESYPNGAIVLFLRARFFLVSGDLDTAIFFYNKSIEAQDVYLQFHHICYWELLFAYSYMRRWDRAANHAKRLLDDSRWSRCVYTYMLAILINADTTVPVNKRSETVKMLLTKIPSIRLRIAGKSIPVEKFAEKKAQRFLRRGILYYPHYEFMYFWNGFSILDGHPNFVRPIIDDIEAMWRSNPSEDPDDESLYLFLMGVCYRSLKENYKAEDCFLKVMENEKRLTDYFYLVPNACFELALVRADLNRGDEVEALLAKARAYKGYSLETKLHFRIHSAMEKFSGSRTPMN